MKYFTKGEKLLWAVSAAAVIGSFVLFDRTNRLTLTASLVGVTSLLFNAKGNPIGQVLMVLFSLMYGIISWQAQYYGEMITYLGMNLSWQRMARRQAAAQQDCTVWPKRPE